MNTNNFYIDVVLPIPVQQDFTYHVPPELESEIAVGCRVIVQFGTRKLYTALIKRIHNQKPKYETKPIEMVLDNTPIISHLQFPFWEWIANYYMCSEGEVMKAALPTGLKLESQTSITLNTAWIETEKLTPTEETIYQFLHNQENASIQQINKLTKRANAYPVVKSLLDKGAIIIEENVIESYKPKTIAHIKINETLCNEDAMKETFNKLNRAKKQQELFMLILNELNFYAPNKAESIAKKEILAKTQASENTLKALADRGFIEIFDYEIDRLIEKQQKHGLKLLNNHQEKALNEIYQHFKNKKVTLLHGVTASGKTEIYIKLIEEQLKVGKQVLYLLPEIALTSQIIDRLTAVFGSKAGIYHSRMSDPERVEIWNKVIEFDKSESPKYQLILGARSSLFLPFKKLGLIIVDEEHETSYKQYDPAPRYNARDASVVLGKLHSANILMGTATPSFESFFNIKTEKYGYVRLDKRHHNISLPEIKIADLNDAYKRKQMKSYFTPQLFSEIENALANNEQIILFQNRRGFSPFIQCRNCGWIPKCPNCDVSLTYHKYSNSLQCHYCGHNSSMPNECPNCHSTDVQTKGFGTQKIEDEIKILFPDIKIGRLDVDSTRTKNGYEKVLDKFTSGKTQILVGTQMITKGLDFDNVSVVGILNADNLLNFPDFRSYERAYHLMAQVSGRAGRKNKQGKVIIQTSQPEHPIIHFVKANDYEGMFNFYIRERKTFSYPPWNRIINITIKHKNKDRAEIAAQQLATILRKNLKSKILGPEFHLISRMQQYYQLVIRIKLDKQNSPETTKHYINETIKAVKNYENNSSVIFINDVDPF